MNSVKTQVQKCSSKSRGSMLLLVSVFEHILRLKCTKFDLDWGSAPADPASQRSPRLPGWI